MSLDGVFFTKMQGYCWLGNNYLSSVSDYSLQLKYQGSLSSLAKELLVIPFQKDECPFSKFLKTLNLGLLFLIALVILIFIYIPELSLRDTIHKVSILHQVEYQFDADDCISLFIKILSSVMHFYKNVRAGPIIQELLKRLLIIGKRLSV